MQGGREVKNALKPARRTKSIVYFSYEFMESSKGIPICVHSYIITDLASLSPTLSTCDNWPGDASG